MRPHLGTPTVGLWPGPLWLFQGLSAKEGLPEEPLPQCQGGRGPQEMRVSAGGAMLAPTYLLP